MTWVQIQKSTQASWSDYEKVQHAVGAERPDGLILHAAGEVDGGRWQSVSVWESEEHWDRFRGERLEGAARSALGDELVDSGPPPSESFDAKHLWQ